MAQVIADLTGKSISEEVDMGKARVEELTGNTDVPVDAGMLANYSTSTDNLETADQEAEAAKTNYETKITLKKAAEA